MSVRIETVIDNSRREAVVSWPSVVGERAPENNGPVPTKSWDEPITIRGTIDAIRFELTRLARHKDPEISQAAEAKSKSFVEENAEAISGPAATYRD